MSNSSVNSQATTYTVTDTHSFDDDDALRAMREMHEQQLAVMKKKQQEMIEAAKERRAEKKIGKKRKVLQMEYYKATQISERVWEEYNNSSMAYWVAGKKLTAALKAKREAKEAFKNASMMVDDGGLVAAFKRVDIGNSKAADTIRPLKAISAAVRAIENSKVAATNCPLKTISAAVIREIENSPPAATNRQLKTTAISATDWLHNRRERSPCRT
jgi:hypothetical protein